MNAIIKSLFVSRFVLCVLFIVAVAGCKKMDHTYREFIGDGETIYVGMADSLKAVGGNQRIQVSWLLIADPKVAAYKVFWNAGRDSLSGTVVKTSAVDTVKLLIDNMDEGTHHFDVYLYDGRGNRSVKSSTIGKVYGERYRQSLLNRAFRTFQRSGANVNITWMPADDTTTRVELNYTDSDGNNVNLIVPASSNATTLSSVPSNAAISYRTFFSPEPQALDEFVTASTTITIP
jgi:hypothetical protein